METQAKRKSFWRRPEGITGALFIIAGLVGLYKILPYAITLVENSLYLGLMIGGVALVSYLVLSNKELIWYLYKTLMYNITKVFVTIDPISIAKVYIASLRGKKENIDEQVEKLGGAIGNLKTNINDNNKGIKKNLTEAEAAKKFGGTKNDMLALRLAKEAQYLKEANDEISPLLTSMETMMACLKKTSEVADFIIGDKESEISIMEKKYKAINIGVTALRSAKSIIGYDEKQAIFEQSMEYVKEDMANKLSEMDRIIELANPYVERMDLKEAVNSEEATKLLEQFSAKEFDKILTSLQTKSTPAPVLLEKKINGEAQKTEANAYSDMLS